MCVGTFAGVVSEDWLLVCTFQHLAQWNVRLIPFEDEEAALFEDAETLGEPCCDCIVPIVIEQGRLIACRACLGIETAVYVGKLALSRIAQQVRRVKHNHGKGIIRVFHASEVSYHIRFHFKVSSIAKRCLNISYILEQYTRVVFVKVEHLASTTSV